MRPTGPEKILIALIFLLAVVAGASFVLPVIVNRTSDVLVGGISDVPPTLLEKAKGAQLKNPPEIIKAVYVTGNSAKSKNYLNYLDNLFKNTEINAVVVNIKGNEGYILYENEYEKMDSLVKFFHDRNIYLIGRIVVFADPVYFKIRPDIYVYDIEKSSEENKVLWQDSGGMLWQDPGSKDAWDYNISIAKNAFYHGFDEINFDYIRFPSDGDLQNAGFPFWDEKNTTGNQAADVIKSFFEYAKKEQAGEKISADIYGQTTTEAGDMGIGQKIENVFGNFDYVCPMLYPSHYVKGYMGFENPAEHPYEIVKNSLDSAIKRNTTSSKIRPWLQDFDMGAEYTTDKIKAQIQATKDALGENYNGYMLWNPSNIYTAEAVLN